MTRSLAIAALLMTSVASLASAEFPAGSYATDQQGRYYGPSVIQRHSSTYQEGVLRGYADFARGVGQYNYLTELARINRQIAVREALANEQLRVETHYNKKRIRQQYLDETATPRVTQQDAENIARDRAPERLDSYHYEPALGKVFWPALLQNDVFASQRAEIDAAMAKRSAHDSGLSSGNYQTVKTNTAAMNEVLRQHIRSINPQEYAAAKSFLNSLNYEAQHTLAPAGFASN
ncbi:MAG: hypothetical protein NXI22_01555 [bacterium]|nr:hypothetical protein [bacterium]